MKKIYVFKRGVPRELFFAKQQSPKEVAYCGYLEVDDTFDPFYEDVWDLCNWACWAREKPKECKHLLITHCNSDVAFYMNNKWYSHDMQEFRDFTHCYSEMVGNTYNKYFSCLWSTDSGFEDSTGIKIVTPQSINQFINL